MAGKITNEKAPGTFTLIPLALFTVALVAGWWYATQRLALSLGYQAQLGEAWFYFGGTPFYRPYQVLTWNYWYHSYAPQQFNDAMKLVYASVGGGVVAVLGYAVWIARRARIATTYGTARWGDRNDMKKAHLLTGQGVVIGVADDGSYITHDGPENVALIAPPRSGKGAGPIISTLLTWPHSVIVNDIRKENWDATAGHRAQFSNVIYFNPTDPTSARFNPLFEVRKGPRAIADAQNVADMIVDPDGNGKPSHWDKTSHALLVAAILHILYAEKDKTMRGLSNFLADPQRDMLTTLNHMLRTDHGDPDVHRAIASAARENLNRSPNELSGVMSTAMSFLGLYRDPIVAANTSSSDFRILDLIHGERPLSLYMVIPPSEINRTRPLMRLVWAQTARKLMEDYTPMHQAKPAGAQRAFGWISRLFGKLVGQQAPSAGVAPGGRRRVLKLADEFPSMGRMDFFETQLAYTGGYGIKAMLVAQSKNQIDKVYGKPNSILDLCHVRYFFTPNDVETAESISTQTGTMTEVHQQKTYTGHRLAPWLAHVMIADQEVSRPLLTPGEVMTFPADQGLIFVAGFPPIRTRKLMYFNDPNLKARVHPAPPLTGSRPYAYRPRPVPSPWAGMVAAASAMADAETAGEAALQELDQPLEAAPDTPSADVSASVTGQADADGQAIDVVPDEDMQERIRRAAFDAEQTQQHGRRHVRDDGPDIGMSI